MTETSTFVSICNRSLTWLGAEPITALTDSTKEGRGCNRIYLQARDQTLRDHPWNFALKRVAIAADTTAPIWDYTNAYSWPTGCLRIIEVDTLEEWVVEGRKILSDQAAPLNILYIDAVSDPTLFDAMFVEAYAARIAADLAYDLTANVALSQSAEAQYRVRIRDARTIDAQESLSADETDWLESRT